MQGDWAVTNLGLIFSEMIPKSQSCNYRSNIRVTNTQPMQAKRSSEVPERRFGGRQLPGKRWRGQGKKGRTKRRETESKEALKIQFEEPSN